MMMYLSSSAISAPTAFATPPVQFSDLTNTVQAQQQHFNVINLNVPSMTGLINPTSVLTSSNGLNVPSTTTTQISSPTNDQQQQQSTQSNSISTSNLTLPSIQQMHLENHYNNVLLREKTGNQLYDPRKTRKRLSDPVYTHHQLQQQQQILQPLLIDQQHYFSSGSGQFLPNNMNLTRDPSTHSLARRRSLRMVKPPIILQTIPQQSMIHFNREPQKLLVVRHAERVDSTFGSGWLDQVFDKSTGQYRRLNLNLPKKMVTRRDLKDFLFDPPITELGLHESKMIGEELAAQGIRIQHVYASPALRCVQTADKILEGLQLREEISIRIEPCLFEFLKWYPVVPVKWPFLDLDELTRNGYHVEKSYKPFYPIESLRKDEDELMYYTRSHFIATSILKNHENDGGNVLIVGHAPTIEVCTRQLTGGQPRINELKFLVLRVPFLSMHCLSRQIDGNWKAIKPPISPIKHAAVEPFDWRFFR